MNLTDKIDALDLRPIGDLTETQQMDLLAIRNHPDVRRNMYAAHVIGEDEHRDWIKRLSTDRQKQSFAVYFEDALVGAVNFSAIQHEDRQADWGFYIDPSRQGNRLGTALGVKVLDFAFETFSLLKGEVLRFNERSLAFHEKLGFRRIGVRRRQILRDGQYHDAVLLEFAAEDWQGKRTELIRGSTDD